MKNLTPISIRCLVMALLVLAAKAVSVTSSRQGELQLQAQPRLRLSLPLPSSRKLSIWSSFLNLLKCPPGPLGHRPACQSGNGSGNGNGNGGGDYNNNNNNNNVSASNSNGGDYYSNANNANANNANNNANNNNGSNNGGAEGTKKNAFQTFFTSRSGKLALIIISAVAASIAIAAMYMNSRTVTPTSTTSDGGKHPLNGILQRRMGLFQRLADRTANCGTCRPDAAVLSDDNDDDIEISSSPYKRCG